MMSVMEKENWQHLLRLGNQCYQEQQWQQAEYHYELAFVLLLEHCQSEPKDVDSLMAWICTCHNLSALFESQNKLPAAMRYLLLPHEHCRHIVAEHSAEEEAKSIAIQAMSVTMPPIVEFSNNYPHLNQTNGLMNAALSGHSTTNIH